MATTWYLAGPMSGLPQFNFPAFYAAAKDLRDQGYRMVSPAELDDAEDAAIARASKDGDAAAAKRSWGEFLGRDIQILADDCDGMILLPGWEKSPGARLEVCTALIREKVIAFYEEGVQPRLASEDMRNTLWLVVSTGVETNKESV